MLRRPLAPALPLLFAAACGGSGPPLDWPRLTDETGIDPVLLERIRLVESACARREPGSWLELAMVYDANDLNGLAARTYEACLALPADEAGASPAMLHFHRARALEDFGRSDEALRAFDAALALQDDYAPVRWRRGQVLLDAGRVDEARADFERAIELEPESVPAHLGLARVLLVQDEPARARDLLLAVIARRPDERYVHGLLSRALLAVGDEAGAAEELRREDAAATTTMADPVTAEMRQKVIGVQPGVLAATDLLKAGKAAEAARLLWPLHQKVPEDLAVLQMLGRALVTAEEHERALELLTRGAKLHPEDYKLEYLAGLACEGKGSLAEALAHFERVRTLNPHFPPAHAALGKAHIALGRFAEAEANLARALELGDGELQTVLLLGQAQSAQSAWPRAVATFERARTQAPDSAQAWILLAEAQARAGNAEAAEVALAEATRLSPGSKRIQAVRKLLGKERSAE